MPDFYSWSYLVAIILWSLNVFAIGVVVGRLWHARDRQRIVRMVRQLGMGK